MARTEHSMLVIVNCATLNEPLTLSALVFQTSAVVILYMVIFYVMDLYDSALMSFSGTLLLNLVQATGILLVIIGVVTAGTHILNLDPRLMIAHTLLTVVFVLLARLAIQRSAIPAIRRRFSPPLPVIRFATNFSGK